MMSSYYIPLLLSMLVSLISKGGCTYSVALTSSTIEDVLKSNELVFVNFYADWCRFSQMLAPVFEDAAGQVKKDFPEEGKVVFGKVDCDRETGVATQYHVNKYPTLKMYRHGTLVKREYRGQRSADALANYIKDQLLNPVANIQNMDDLDNIDRKKRHIIGYFDSEDNNDYSTFRKLATMLRDDCKFHAALGEVSEKDRMGGNKMVYRPPGEHPSDMLYSGPLADYNMMLQWTQDKCVPLVREITFENAEELTEEGLPFLILFHNPEDTETAESYRRICARELLAEKNGMNFLTADGLKFTHPLFHLGKTAKDLPVLAIDSFRHMYMWKNDVKADIEKPGLLKQFIADLHSGKLHREFHHGPDPATQPQLDMDRAAGGEDNKQHIPKEADAQPPSAADPIDPTTPPESSFKKLAPSKSRYTLLKDEL